MIPKNFTLRLVAGGILFLGLGTLFQGCATLIQGDTQDVIIDSDPQGAEITINGQRQGISPRVIQLARGKAHLLELRKDGYRPHSTILSGTVEAGWVILDVLCGLIPVIVDVATADWKDFGSRAFAVLHPETSSDSLSFRAAEARPTPGDIAYSGELKLESSTPTLFPGGSGVLTFKSSSFSTSEIVADETIELLDSSMKSARQGPLSLSKGSKFLIRTANGDFYEMEVLGVRGTTLLIKYQLR